MKSPIVEKVVAAMVIVAFGLLILGVTAVILGLIARLLVLVWP